MKVIDLSYTISEESKVFLGDPTPQLQIINTVEQDGFKQTLLQFVTHTGTHIDAPAHVFKDGKTLDAFLPESFIGAALVIDYHNKSLITMDDLYATGDLYKQADFLLFHQSDGQYLQDYAALDEEVLDYLVHAPYKGIGFDVMSIDPIDDETLYRHKKILQTNKIMIENLKNLSQCGHQLFTLYALPLKMKASDGAPARVMAILDA